MKAQAYLLKDVQRWRGTSADDVAKMLGTAAASFGGTFVAELFSVTELEKRNR